MIHNEAFLKTQSRTLVISCGPNFPGFYSMKWLGVFLPPTLGWDASPSQGYPAALNLLLPIYTPGWREALWRLSVLLKSTAQCPKPWFKPRPLDLEMNAVTMRPPCLHSNFILVYTTQVNSAFCALWLVNLEVFSKYYSPPSSWRERF